jgi:hypothetical protein
MVTLAFPAETRVDDDSITINDVRMPLSEWLDSVRQMR